MYVGPELGDDNDCIFSLHFVSEIAEIFSRRLDHHLHVVVQLQLCLSRRGALSIELSEYQRLWETPVSECCPIKRISI